MLAICICALANLMLWGFIVSLMYIYQHFVFISAPAMFVLMILPQVSGLWSTFILLVLKLDRYKGWELSPFLVGFGLFGSLGGLFEGWQLWDIFSSLGTLKPENTLLYFVLFAGQGNWLVLFLQLLAIKRVNLWQDIIFAAAHIVCFFNLFLSYPSYILFSLIFFNPGI